MKHQKTSFRGEFYKKSNKQKLIERRILESKVFELFIDYKFSTKSSFKTSSIGENKEKDKKLYSIEDIFTKEDSWLETKVFKMLV